MNSTAEERALIELATIEEDLRRYQPDGDGDTPMVIAAQRGALGVVEYLHRARGVDLEAKGKGGYRPIHWACHTGSLKVVEYLAGQGASLDAPTNFGHHQIHLAALTDQSEVVQWLTDPSQGGVPFGQPTEAGAPFTPDTPLLIAAEQGAVGVVELLHRVRGADLEEGKGGNRPIHYACHNGHLKVVEYLAGQGASLTGPNEEEAHPIHLAAHEDHVEVVEWLTDQSKGCIPFDQPTIEGGTPLMIAAQGDALGVVEFLHKARGADLEQQGQGGIRPIHYACRGGHLKVVEYLAGQGASLTCPTDDGEHPIHLAARCDNTEVVEWLTDPSTGGVPPDQPNDDGDPLLVVAACNGALGVVEYLHRAWGADLEKQGPEGFNPIHCACLNGHLEVVEYLAGQGASLDVPTDSGYPIHLAALKNQFAVVEWLVDPSKGELGNVCNWDD